jgi:hypothetical protein
VWMCATHDAVFVADHRPAPHGRGPSLFGRRSWLIVTLRAGGGEPGGVTALWKAELLARIAIATATARGFQGHMAMAEGMT